MFSLFPLILVIPLISAQISNENQVETVTVLPPLVTSAVAFIMPLPTQNSEIYTVTATVEPGPFVAMNPAVSVVTYTPSFAQLTAEGGMMPTVASITVFVSPTPLLDSFNQSLSETSTSSPDTTSQTFIGIGMVNEISTPVVPVTFTPVITFFADGPSLTSDNSMGTPTFFIANSDPIPTTVPVVAQITSTRINVAIPVVATNTITYTSVASVLPFRYRLETIVAAEVVTVWSTFTPMTSLVTLWTAPTAFAIADPSPTLPSDSSDMPLATLSNSAPSLENTIPIRSGNRATLTTFDGTNMQCGQPAPGGMYVAINPKLLGFSDEDWINQYAGASPSTIPWCGKTIQITVGAQTGVYTIMDTCQPCDAQGCGPSGKCVSDDVIDFWSGNNNLQVQSWARQGAFSGPVQWQIIS